LRALSARNVFILKFWLVQVCIGPQPLLALVVA